MRITVVPTSFGCHDNYYFLCQDKWEIQDKLVKEENGQVGGGQKDKGLLEGRGQAIPNENGELERHSSVS